MNEPLLEAVDSNEALDVTSAVISPKPYKPRHEALPGSATQASTRKLFIDATGEFRYLQDNTDD